MKKNHRILFVMALAVVGLLASCNKNNGDEYTGDGFRATIEQPGGNGGSRTHINPENWNDGTEWPVLWTEGDQVLVRNNVGDLRLFQLQSGANTNDGIFMPADGEEYDYESGPFCAVYSPEVSQYAEDPEALAQVQELLFSGTTAMVSVPTTQVYKANSFAEGAMPMAAYGNGQTLEFKNLCGGLCFAIVGDKTITKIEVTSLDADDAVSGFYNVDCTDPTHSLTPYIYNYGGVDYSMAGNQVTLDCPGGVTLGAEPTYFTVMVAPGSLESGFTVKAYNGNDVVDEKTADWSANPQTGFIPRSVIRKVNQNLGIVNGLVVTTISPTFISTNSALGLGMVGGDGTPTSCGILYALASDLATPADDLVIGGTNVTNLAGTVGTRFDASLTGLAEDQIYYVRAWAKNVADEVYYGDPVPFATRYDYYGHGNNGKSRGVFSVSATNQVRFSMGNLQFQAAGSSLDANGNLVGGTWRFAEYQYDFMGNTEGNVNPSATQTAWQDLFAFGTSGWNSGATCYLPYADDGGHFYNYVFGPNYSTNMSGAYANADWGVYNAISNGGNATNMWRTLQGGPNDGHTPEWDYIFNSRTCTYKFATVRLVYHGTSADEVSMKNGVPACGPYIMGVVFFPDNFTWPTLVNNGELTLNQYVSGVYADISTVNHIPESQWSLLEQQGAIFLPSAGVGGNHHITCTPASFYYWSSTAYDRELAYHLRCFSNNVLNTQCLDANRGTHRAVRLVSDVNTSGNFNNQPFGVNP